MAKKDSHPVKRKNLPKSKNGIPRKGIYFTGYKGQKEELRIEAKRKGVSVNYLLNLKNFKDWFD
jgi:hypothetical protein